MATLLQADGLTKAFGGLVAVNGMSLSVSPGEVLGLIGPNGSGKTTLLNLIAGTIRADAGTIRMDGRDVTGLSNHLRVRNRINRTFQLVRTQANMPVIVAVMAGTLYGAEPIPYRDAEYEAAGILGELNLLTKAGRRLDQLTYIEQKRVELARALATKPRVLLLDEWLSGLILVGIGRRHVSGLEPCRPGHRGGFGRACDDRGARAVWPCHRHECRGQDRRGHARCRAARSRGGPRLPGRRQNAQVYGLSHTYGQHEALHQVAIKVGAGEVVAILGANGAGKTTLATRSPDWSSPRAARSALTTPN